MQRARSDIYTSHRPTYTRRTHRPVHVGRFPLVPLVPLLTHVKFLFRLLKIHAILYKEENNMLGNTLIDNSPKLKLIDTLNEIISMPEINEICIATGYWDLKGTALITDSLFQFLSRENTKLRLLIGKDPNIFKKDLTSDAYKNAKHYPKDYLKIDLQNVEMNNEQYQKTAKMLIDYCSDEQPKIEVHIFELNENDERQFFHSKCYIFTDGTDDNSFGIIGSSNFTEKGLIGNSELNYLETNGMIVNHKSEGTKKGHLQWFNEKWKLSKDWTKDFVIEIENSPVGTKVKTSLLSDTSENLTSYENYIKLLQDKFGMITDTKFKSILMGYLPKDIKPLEYQLNAVQQCYSYMIQHGGFALGDVVGLGKTVVGILLIKYYIEVSSSLKKSDKVLMIVPPAIKSSWLDTIKKFDKNQTNKIEEHVRFLTTGSLNHLVEDFSEEELSDAEDTIEDEDLFTYSLSKSLAKESVVRIDSSPSAQNDERNVVLKDEKMAIQHDVYSENYGLVIIDESHKFRNKNTEMYIALSEYLENVNVRTGYYPFVGLLSATMQNNNPRDIQNQIYLFEHEPKNSSFEKVEGRDLEHFFAEVNKKYNMLIHTRKNPIGIEQASFTSDENTKKELIALSKEVREKVLSDILVHRTRTDIKKHYSDDLKFPKVHGPENLYYTMDKKLSQLFSDTMNMIATESELGYYRYRATMFLDSKYEKVYSGRNMTAQRSSNQLAHIMQILLVKRLESSFEAFKESLRNFQRYTQNMITMWEHDTIFICPQIDVNKELYIKDKQARNPDKVITLETCFDDIRTKIKKLNKEGRNEKKQNAEYTRADFKGFDKNNKSYIDYLKSDLEKINHLVERWNENDYDPKLDRFKLALRESSGLFCKERNIPHKLVIFSEAISTVNSLSRAVENITGKEPLVITAANRDEMESVIKENFDANCEKEKQKNNYDVIITTEVLAEGINLHRANSILNYDTPWNSTRLIQRIGRVNRIGSENEDIYVYNFYPSSQGDKQINLVQNAYTKLQSFHTMFGEDAKIFSEDEELSEGNFESFVDGDESPQEKYIYELKRFRDENPARYDLIQSLEKAEEKSVQPLTTDKEGNSYFAIKVKNKYGCVYVKVGSDLQTKVINYMEMFDACKCSEETTETCNSDRYAPSTRLLHSDDSEVQAKRKAAFDAYNVYENRLSRAKNSKVSIANVLAKANKWISSGTLQKESMALVGQAVKSIKNGNTILAKRLDKVLTALGTPESQLIPITSEEVVNMIQQELCSIAASNTQKHGEAYIFAGFYY